jgi:NAD-dependent SIR2 family protein deacetylase
MRRGGHHRIPPEQRHEVLGGDLSLRGVARRLGEGRYKNVVALIGAGASTTAGVPDFRSPNGLWSQAATRELFSLQGFLDQPEAFWRKSSELFLGRQPTKVHALLARMAKMGVLRRLYTQNIDGLEAAAGVPPDAIIECHGSAMRTVCSANRSHAAEVTPAQIAAQLTAAEGTEEEGMDRGVDGRRWTAPRCGCCGALLRPDIVFFGEPLPKEFSQRSGEDMDACDLLIVIGTALSVYPVAGLVSRVSQLTPRLLLNKEAVGVWRACESNAENYRDVLWKGDCDAGAEELARELGVQL